jgi:methylmalonyl-CoA mutase N-terminal domain/subunit
MESAKKSWEITRLEPELKAQGEMKDIFKTSSGLTVDRVYLPRDSAQIGDDYLNKLGFPGSYPYTRGITPTMYRGMPPRIFAYSGYQSAEATNERFKYLLSQGVRELIIASDLPTQIGYDSDNPLARGEVARIGVPINSLADMEMIFDGIALDDVFVGAQTNANSVVMVAFILATGEKRQIPQERIKFSVQNDVLKEYFARGTYIFPPRVALKLTCDVVEYVVRNKMTDFAVPISYCGYHTREAGGTAVQEMAFTLADAVEYIEELIRRGIGIDEIPVPRGNFVAGLDLFEEVAKSRAFRRMWARLLKERYGATNPGVLAFTFTGGSQASLYTAQQPMNNVVRGTISALAQILSGWQSTYIAAMDEALSTPTEESVTLALRTMQIVANETGIMNTIDPLGGSYYLESLTDELEKQAMKLFEQIQSMGGAVNAIEQGFQENELGKSAYEYMKKVKNREVMVVGVNAYQTSEKPRILTTRVDYGEERRQIERLQRLRRERNNDRVAAALKDLSEAARERVNLIEPVLEAVRVYATGGEVFSVLRDIYGEYKSAGLMV